MFAVAALADTGGMGVAPLVALVAAAAMGPGAGASAHRGLVEQQRALAALPGPGAPVERSYQRVLVHVEAALSALRATESALVTRAHTKPIPNVAAIERDLDQALGADNVVDAVLTSALQFFGRMPLPADASVGQLRTLLRRGLTATIPLAKLTDGL
jgi:hypothetical protein